MYLAGLNKMTGLSDILELREGKSLNPFHFFIYNIKIEEADPYTDQVASWKANGST